MKDLTNYLRRKTASEEELQAADAIEKLAAALVAKDEAIVKVYGCYPPLYSKEPVAVIARQALALQPHAELVAKMKADAVRSVIPEFVIEPSTQANAIKAYADRIERGEVK